MFCPSAQQQQQQCTVTCSFLSCSGRAICISEAEGGKVFPVCHLLSLLTDPARTSCARTSVFLFLLGAARGRASNATLSSPGLASDYLVQPASPATSPCESRPLSLVPKLARGGATCRGIKEGTMSDTVVPGPPGPFVAQHWRREIGKGAIQCSSGSAPSD
eukprot:m51a1_g8021 hypothetical protein (161) ;mRNA; f:228896-230372